MKYFDVNCSFLVGLDDMMDGKDPPTHPPIHPLCHSLAAQQLCTLTHSTVVLSCECLWSKNNGKGLYTWKMHNTRQVLCVMTQQCTCTSRCHPDGVHGQFYPSIYGVV